MTLCPHCGLEKGEGPKYWGHLSYCKQHPESRPTKEPATTPKGLPSKQTSTVAVTATTIAPAPVAGLEPVTFTFTEGERLPAQQEIPEFKTPEQEKKEKASPETVKATLAEERKAGVSAIAALILPLFEMWNRNLEGQSAFPTDAASMRLTKDDAENLAQAVLLVDAKHGGPLSKTLGSEEYGAELFLVGVSLGLGIKMYLGLRMRRSASTKRPPATAGTEQPREKSPLEKVGDSLRALVTSKKEAPKPEPAEASQNIERMTPDQFDTFTRQRMRELESAGGG